MANNWYNNDSGTWVIKGGFNDTRLLKDSGNYLYAISGNGTVVITFNRDWAKVFANGALQYTTAPPNTSVTGDGVILCESGVVGNMLFVPIVYSDSQAISAATGDVQLEWIFENDSTIVAKFDEQEYGIRSLTDGADVIRSQTLQDGFTFERATPKWVYSASGKLVEVPANEPAYQHDPVTGEPQGLLIEGSRTNLVLGSSDFSSWSRSGSSTITQGIADGKGVSALSEIIEDTSEGRHQVTQQVTVNDGEPIAISFTWKPTGSRSPYVYFTGVDSGEWGSPVHFRSDGSVGGSGLNDVASAYQTQLPNGSFAATIISNPIGGPDVTGTLYFRLYNEDLSSTSYTGDGTSSLLLGEVQVEVGSSPSSYIPTTDAPVTRAADNVYRELGDEFNNNAFSAFAEFYFDANKISSTPYSPNFTGGGDGRVSLRFSGGGGPGYALQIVDNGGTIILNSYAPSLADKGINRVAVSVSGSEAIVAVNGVSSVFAISGIPDITSHQIGDHLGSGRTNTTWFKNVVYPYALTEQELIYLTS